MMAKTLKWCISVYEAKTYLTKTEKIKCLKALEVWIKRRMW